MDQQHKAVLEIIDRSHATRDNRVANEFSAIDRLCRRTTYRRALPDASDGELIGRNPNGRLRPGKPENGLGHSCRFMLPGRTRSMNEISLWSDWQNRRRGRRNCRGRQTPIGPGRPLQRF